MSQAQRVIIIGASGLIGSQLFSAAKQAGRTVLGTYTGNPKEGLHPFDLRSERLSDLLAGAIGPGDVVFLLSAYSNPNWVLQNPEEARRLNVDGSKRVIDEVVAAGARLVFMSSVEVFDGQTGAYAENAQPAPLNLYGKMKYEVECHLATIKERVCLVRTGWNVGWDATHRCVIQLTYETLLGSGAKMANDNTFSIADVRDTAAGLLSLADRPDVTRLHLASPQILVRNSLAQTIRTLSRQGSKMNFSEVPFGEIPYKEPRARLNDLDTRFAKDVLGLSFRNAADIIREKVALLDSAANS